MAGTDYDVKLAIKGTSVSVAVNGALAVSHAFNGPIVDGAIGTLGRGGTTSFESFRMLTNDATLTVVDTRRALAAVAAAAPSPAPNLDTNGDGIVSPIDALLVINHLNDVSIGAATQSGRSVSSLLDANGDGTVSPLDALLVINELNAASAAGRAPQATSPVNDLGGAGVFAVSDELLAALATDLESSARRSRTEVSKAAAQASWKEDRLDRVFDDWR